MRTTFVLVRCLFKVSASRMITNSLLTVFPPSRRASEQGSADGGFVKAKPCVLRCSSFSPKSLRLFGDPIVYTPIIPKKTASASKNLPRLPHGRLCATHTAQNKANIYKGRFIVSRCRSGSRPHQNKNSTHTGCCFVWRRRRDSRCFATPFAVLEKTVGCSARLL